jgi:toxin ParE1/3/4
MVRRHGDVSEKRFREAYIEAALEEILEAEFYFETQREGLGEVFREELNAVVDILLEFPESGRIINKKGIRKQLLSRFPYAIIYVLDEDILLILAVAHTSRKPNYWKDRWS